ncbi:unnamed protein product [Orchesella dallaii]|uniref:Uncharacterized protein n=1 Tax=Orchesella dallaii TaxID=48710 RepID=A0ABP1PYJ8_9HEXA
MAGHGKESDTSSRSSADPNLNPFQPVEQKVMKIATPIPLRLGGSQQLSRVPTGEPNRRRNNNGNIAFPSWFCFCVVVTVAILTVALVLGGVQAYSCSVKEKCLFGTED